MTKVFSVSVEFEKYIVQTNAGTQVGLKPTGRIRTTGPWVKIDDESLSALIS